MTTTSAPPAVPADALQTAVALARTAGAMVRSATAAQPGHPIANSRKEDGSEVTVVDLAINDLVLTELTRRFPGHHVLGEEASSSPAVGGELRDGFSWVCDPLDGTMLFSLGMPGGPFSLALCHDGVPILAVCADPWTGLLLTAQRGQGTWSWDANDVRIAVRSTGRRTVTGARLDFVPHRASRSGRAGGQYDRLVKADAVLMNLWCAVRSGMNVAVGGLDALVFDSTSCWDVAATTLLVTEAGGGWLPVDGGAPSRLDGDVPGAILASSPELAERLRELLS